MSWFKTDAELNAQAPARWIADAIDSSASDDCYVEAEPQTSVSDTFTVRIKGQLYTVTVRPDNREVTGVPD